MCASMPALPDPDLASRAWSQDVVSLFRPLAPAVFPLPVKRGKKEKRLRRKEEEITHDCRDKGSVVGRCPHAGADAHRPRCMRPRSVQNKGHGSGRWRWQWHRGRLPPTRFLFSPFPFLPACLGGRGAAIRARACGWGRLAMSRGHGSSTALCPIAQRLLVCVGWPGEGWAGGLVEWCVRETRGGAETPSNMHTPATRMEGEPVKRSFLQKFFGSNLPNPGKFEDISAEANRIFLLETFEGVRVDWQRPLSNAFGVNHLLHLQPSQDTYGSYHFGANFADGQHLVLSRTSTAGAVDARYILTATPNLTVSCQSQLSPIAHQSMAVVSADYKGTDYFAQAKVGADGAIPACTHARTHARLHARTHASLHACTHASLHARTHACLHARAQTHPTPFPPALAHVAHKQVASMAQCVFSCLCVCVCVCVCVCIYIYSI